ncbi:OmpA family protein [uncultured Marixanthomonas sp.]|uniref:OmpA family protein n=1 Tax=uncultured Marixanthomonas sp. TaxID=757245 RepID=UPI0030DA7C63
MKLHITILFTLFLCINVGVKAQNKAIKKGDENYKNLSYVNATENYLKVAKNEKELSAESLKKLGDSYYVIADYENAAKWYAKLFEEFEISEADYLYRYAQSLKSTEQYDLSNKIMKKLEDLNKSDIRANLFIDNQNYVEEIEKNSGRFQIEVASFNSKSSDFAPFMYGDTLVFASNRSTRGPVKRINEWNNSPFFNLYSVSSSSEKQNKFDSEINTKYHESTAVFSPDGKTMYFTRSNYTNKEFRKDATGVNHLKLYRARKNNEKWNVEELPFSSDDYSVAHPALSPDGKTLYFSSDMPGGKGMSDLYKVAIKADGFGNPELLKGVINTEGRETFPFVAKNGNLYFASDGHVGLGGLDVFVAFPNGENVFTEVQNIGEPINSNKDDFTFIIDEEKKTGYFASNRGKNNNDDIYKVTQIEPLLTPCFQSINGMVYDENTNTILPNVKVVLYNATNEKVEEQTSDSKGAFNFINVECSATYTLRSEKDEYITSENKVTTTEESNKIIATKVVLVPKDLNKDKVGEDLFKLLDLKPINFDLNKSDIRKDAKIELQKIIAYLNKYPTVKIDIRSHTDSRGSDVYNEKLSDRRAKSTLNYLVKEGGIDAARITGKGYGETQLLNKCKNGVSCTNEEHERNRRSEFIIVEK